MGANALGCAAAPPHCSPQVAHAGLRSRALAVLALVNKVTHAMALPSDCDPTDVDWLE